VFLCFSVSLHFPFILSSQKNMADPQPLIENDFFADPSGRVFNNKLYIYPSHDRKTEIPDDDNGSQYDMADYHVLSMDKIGGKVTDHGIAFGLEDVKWADKQLWVCKPNYSRYLCLYDIFRHQIVDLRMANTTFTSPARDHEGIFRIGVAVGDKPEGPFTPESEAIEGSFSIDPAVLVDDDGQAYLYFGGIWGGQLQCWRSDKFDRAGYNDMEATGDEPALLPRVAKLSEDMKSFNGGIHELVITDTDGKPNSRQQPLSKVLRSGVDAS
jgi:hypothetical protein